MGLFNDFVLVWQASREYLPISPGIVPAPRLRSYQTLNHARLFRSSLHLWPLPDGMNWRRANQVQWNGYG